MAWHRCARSLRGAVEAAASKILKLLLVGPEARIRTLAASLDLDLDDLRVVDQPHSHAAAAKAVELIRAG
jgi:phosphate acetyltransferase